MYCSIFRIFPRYRQQFKCETPRISPYKFEQFNFALPVKKNIEYLRKHLFANYSLNIYGIHVANCYFIHYSNVSNQ